MTLRKRHQLLAGIVGIATSLLIGFPAAQAQSFPTRPITIVIPFPPGGISDVTTRAIAQSAAAALGQPIIIDNRPGGGGQIGADVVKRAPADGHMLYLASIGSHALNEALYQKLSYDPVRDFEPVIGLFSSPNLLVVSSSNSARSVADLVKQSQAQPGKFSYGSQGVGSGGHLSGEIFKSRTGTDFTHVPYRGSVPALTDLVGDRIALLFDPVISAMPFIRDGRLRALAISAPERSPLFPEVPTLRELGIQGIEVNPWFGLVAPAGTPVGVVTRLNAAFAEALKDSAVRARLSAQGIDAMGGSASEFARFMMSETERWKPVVLESGARAE